MTEPMRLWYKVGTLEVMTDGLVLKPPQHVRVLLQHRGRLDKKVAATTMDRIKATWAYLGALYWCLKNAANVLDGTVLIWRNDKHDTIISNQGVALEYFACLLSLTGLYGTKAAVDRDKRLAGDCTTGLELCAQCCEYGAHHLQRYFSQAHLPVSFRTVTPPELMERARLLRLCAQQELIDMDKAVGALNLMRELSAFSIACKQSAMRAFATAMHTDWEIGMAQHMGQADTDAADMRDYEQALCAQHVIINSSRRLERYMKKATNTDRIVPVLFTKHAAEAKLKAKKTLERLMSQRARYLMVTAAPILGDLDPIAAAPTEVHYDLFSALDSRAIDLGKLITSHAFHDQLALHVTQFASSAARPAESKALESMALLTPDDYAYRKIPPAQRQAVMFGMMVERRRMLEEKLALWPSADIEADLAEVVAGMQQIVLS